MNSPYQPQPPQGQRGQDVMAWTQDVVLPTYQAGEPDKHPMFFEKRVYQGSSGKVYPLPFIDTIAHDKQNKTYQGVWLENAYIRLLILPEIGGRIHLAQDKTHNDYDLFYRQDVIKPALVGLAGPWISGGIEFNWPQHHRPSTFMPADFLIESDDDGGQTIWLSEHDPMDRLKGMVGICLKPGRSNIYAKARLYNRTPQTHTFLWWANVAARVHDNYQSFFPTDVHHVADHAVRATSTFPLAKGTYYGIDYSDNPQGGTDISWYKNIPVPTSYMVTQTDYDFFGGYDHDAQAGFVHVADRHIAPGKKQWTWGNHAFGHAWDRQLSDDQEPYIELMAGVYTDNQPDFSYLAPYETKQFTQTWWPLQQIGPAVNANDDLALALRQETDRLFVGVAAATAMSSMQVLLRQGDHVLLDVMTDLSPGQPLTQALPPLAPEASSLLRLCVRDAQGFECLAYQTPDPDAPVSPVKTATEPPLPEQIASVEELYLTGEHLAQYRHPTRCPEAYWRAGLDRDPGDVRCNTALAALLLSRGDAQSAQVHLERAIERLTHRHPNPVDGQPHYLLGLSCRMLGQTSRAYAAFYKSTWTGAQRAAGYTALAQIDAQRGDWAKTLEHADAAQPHTNARAAVLKALAWRHLHQSGQAQALLREVLDRDPLDHGARWELATCLAQAEEQDQARDERQRMLALARHDPQTLLDLACDAMHCGQWEQAHDLLTVSTPTDPIHLYTLATLAQQQGQHADAARWHRQASEASPDYVFPSRVEEYRVLLEAIARQPDDARAHYYLGNFLYDRKRHDQAIDHWRKATALEPGLAIAWRNLGLGLFNVKQDEAGACAAYAKAFALEPGEGRLLFELDQLDKQVGVAPARRLERLLGHQDLVSGRDDLSVELATLFNLTGRPDLARALLLSRDFRPWEGGEGKVLTQYETSCLLLGDQAMRDDDPALAAQHYADALQSPANLGEARHLLAADAHIRFAWGAALSAQGDTQGAQEQWGRVAVSSGDFSDMAVCEHSSMSFDKAMSLRALGRESQAVSLLNDLQRYGNQLLKEEAKIDYFATSLPLLLVFEDDPRKRQDAHAYYLVGLAQEGLGQADEARASFAQVLQRDPNHQDVLRQLESGAGRLGC